MSRLASTVSVAEGYGRWAATYDHVPNPLLAREERELFPLIQGIRCNRILDLACGTGRWLKRLNAHGATFGIDNSAAMLQVARDKWSGQLAQGACEQLPFRDGAFDLALCSFAFGHIADLKSTVAELARVMRPDSNLFVSDLHPDALAHGWRVGFRDEGGALEIETSPHVAAEIVRLFCSEGFACLSNESLWLGAAEKPLFEQGEKTEYFEKACEIPAVIVFHFRRNDSPRSRDSY